MLNLKLTFRLQVELKITRIKQPNSSQLCRYYSETMEFLKTTATRLFTYLMHESSFKHVQQKSLVIFLFCSKYTILIVQNIT